MRIIQVGFFAAVVVVVLAMAGVASAAANPGLLSADEVKKLVNAGQYQDALKALAPILELRGLAAAPYNRPEMMMLRAECLIQMKDRQGALTELDLARKEAAAAANDDQVSEASALSMLIKASTGWNYTPLTGSILKPIPIADRTLRKGAYDALLADQMAQITIKVNLAKKANKLPPLIEAAKLVVAIRPVEKVSAGDNKQTDQMIKDLADQSLKLISTAVDELATQTQTISDSANRLVTDNATMMGPKGQSYVVQMTHKVGLTPQDAATLKNVIAECGKIAPAATELAQFFSVGDPAPFKAVATKAQTTKDNATKALTANYSSNVN